MKVTIKNNVLTVATNIPVTAMNAGKITKEAEKDSPAYTVQMSVDACLSKFGMKCNSAISGKAATIIVLPIMDGADAYKRYVKSVYGEALNAAKVTDEMAIKAQAYSDELEALIEVEDEEITIDPATAE